MNSLVSIIMPCHNGQKYLRAAAYSVIAQTYKNWELLIIDDNSSDSSKEIIKILCKKDSRIKGFQTSYSSGNPATARNVGIANAQGRFIAFLDCDDLWEPTKLERQIPLFDDRKCAIVFSFYEKIDSDGKRNNRIIRSPKQADFNRLLRGDCIGNLTGMYDTKKVGKVFQKERHQEDYLMYLSILDKGFIAQNTQTTEGYYRVHKSSFSANKFKHLKWQWDVYREVYNFNILHSIYLYFCYATKALKKFII